ncbi:hypothetical protein AB0L25_06760 [Spirillospora sp. NPDC052242]
MGSQGRPKKKINDEYPHVAAFSGCLRDLMEARGLTKEKWLKAAGVKSHSRLDCYINGEAVPEVDVLEVYFVEPLAAVRELDDEEDRRLWALYRAARDELPPKKATSADQVSVLKSRLAAADDTIARLWDLVRMFAAHGEENRRTAEKLRAALRQLEADLAAAKMQLKEAENAARQGHAQAEWLKIQTTWFSHNMTRRAMEIVGLHRHARDLEAELVRSLQTIARQGETIQQLEVKLLLYDRLSAHQRRVIAALRNSRVDDEGRYRRTLAEWDRCARQWEQERWALAGQVADLRRRVDRLKAENLQIGAVSPAQGNATGAVELGRAAWHLDAADPGLEVYWDGQQWTGEKRPASPATRRAGRSRGRHARPEPAWVERNAAAAWQGYCIGYAAVMRERPGWASSVMARKPALPELPSLLIPGRPTAVLTVHDPARQAFEAGFWHAIENKCLTEGEGKGPFRRSRRGTGGGRHVSPTATTVPDLPSIPGPRSAHDEPVDDGSWTTRMSGRSGLEHHAFWPSPSRFRLRR